MPHDPSPPPIPTDTIPPTDTAPPEAPAWDGPVSASGRPLPRWAAYLPLVLGHFIVDVTDTPETPDPHLTAFAARGPVEARVRAAYRGRVYAVRNVSEETWATLAAQYSRSPNTLRDNIRAALACGDIPVPVHLADLLPGPDAADCGDEFRDLHPALVTPGASRMEAKAAAFHRKWTVGYGHGSVGEHATLRLCIDGCSLWAAKALEDARVGAAYTEKSTRYVPFDDGAQPPEALWVQPEELGLDVAHYPDGDSTATPSDGGTAELYRHTMQHWFTVYRDAVGRLTTEARALPGVDDRTSPAALRGWVLDRARDFLPLGARTGLAMTINARSLAHHIRRLGAADQTPEVRYLAALLTSVGVKVCPALIRHVEPRDNATACNAIVRATVPMKAFVAAACERIATEDFASTNTDTGTPNTATPDAAGTGAPGEGIADTPVPLPLDIDGDDPMDPTITPDGEGNTSFMAVASGDTEAAKRRDNAELAWAILREALRPADVVGRHGPAAPLRRYPHNPERVIRAWSEARGPHEGLSRAAEAVILTTDVPMSLGAWRDIQRHRKLTHYRFATPLLSGGFAHDPVGHPGCESLRESIVHGCRSVLSLEYRAGAYPPGIVTFNGPGSRSIIPVEPAEPGTPTRAAALYALPLVTRVVPMIGGTLRAWAQMVELRSRREGHDEYRAIAQHLGDFLMGYFPGLTLRIDREPRTFARK